MVFVDAFTPDLFSLERESLFYSIASSRLPSFVRHVRVIVHYFCCVARCL